MNKIVNHQGVELCVGDRIKIISEQIKGKSLANVSIDEIVTITGFSEDGKILYHHTTLALKTILSYLYKMNNSKI
jgi:hypothetical protein